MSEMVERVARAICLAEFGDENVHGEARCCQVGGVDGCCLGDVLPVARAAIEAMREPTQAMMEAYLDLEPMDNERSYNPPAARTAWQAMLAAALGEGGE